MGEEEDDEQVLVEAQKQAEEEDKDEIEQQLEGQDKLQSKEQWYHHRGTNANKISQYP